MIRACCTVYGLRCVEYDPNLVAHGQAKHQKRNPNVPEHSLKIKGDKTWERTEGSK